MANTSSEQTLSQAFRFPYHGELCPAMERRFAETILLVPFYGAKRTAMQRHVQYLNELGYDVLQFELYEHRLSMNQKIISSSGRFGLKNIWTEQIESLLNSIPGKKIVFSFSNSSVSAIEAIARRKAYDVQALICDSGPSKQLFKSIVNFYTHFQPISFLPLRYLASLGSSLLWAPDLIKDLDINLAQLPQGFKILSIRGWKDKIIPTHAIDEVFEGHPYLDWQKLSLPQASHLNGLRDFKNDYELPVKNFLESVSSPLQSDK